MIYFNPLQVYTKFEDWLSQELRNLWRKNLLGEKEKWKIKGNDKHEDADSLLHDLSSHTQRLYPIFVPNFKILVAVVTEKSLMKNFTGEKEK